MSANIFFLILKSVRPLKQLLCGASYREGQATMDGHVGGLKKAARKDRLYLYSAVATEMPPDLLLPWQQWRAKGCP